MATPSCIGQVFQLLKSLILLLVVGEMVLPSSEACYTSLFSFGNSYADTGNYYFSSPEKQKKYCFLPPYGETYFGHPNGRCSDGRLVVDFISESMGIPLLKPYLGIENEKLGERNIKQGVNFAVIGATAVESSFFQKRRISIDTNLSLNVQVEWFKELLPTICNSLSSCKTLLGNALFLIGEIGGNDVLYSSFSGKSIEEIKTYLPHIISSITSAVSELINLGAETLVVTGSVPYGCMPVFLTLYRTTNKEEYDEDGCHHRLNNFAHYSNQQLQAAVDQLRVLHPHVTIVFSDYFNNIRRLYHKPDQFGFTGPALKACCGGDGPYNFNNSAMCGFAVAVACDDPSQYVSWDGIHMTEASYKWIAKGIIDGPYSNPQMNISCISNRLSPSNINIYPWKKYLMLQMKTSTPN